MTVPGVSVPVNMYRKVSASTWSTWTNSRPSAPAPLRVNSPSVAHAPVRMLDASTVVPGTGVKVTSIQVRGTVTAEVRSTSGTGTAEPAYVMPPMTCDAVLHRMPPVLAQLPLTNAMTRSPVACPVKK